jgi:endonuclease/exonuclease/phosphatase family metal-dependent hydrolase
MSIKVATWNVQEKLALKESPEIVEATKSFDADVVVLTDAYWLGNPLHGAAEERAEEAKEKFAEAGYQNHAVDYGDLPGHWPGRYILALSRLDASFEEVGLGIYNGVETFVKHPDAGGISIIGAHFDDTHEETRVMQAEALVGSVNPAEPSVLAGDFNAFSGYSRCARRLRSRVVRLGSLALPDKKPRNDYEEQHGRPNRLKRLSGMAEGSTMKVLERAGFRDADSQHQPTMPSKRPLFQLDHVMANGHLAVTDFEIHDIRLSDHRPISAVLAL